MNRSADFNYKVALASGLRSLQSGRLRQADEQFRYLVQHFPLADGGYRGLAKVLVEQEDRPGALRTLLDGGAALAKAGERAAAIALYREAVALDPHDLGAHRRLAAALALAGDPGASSAEYVRYIQGAQEGHDAERARLESAYALERLPDDPRIAVLARAAGVGVTRPAVDAHEPGTDAGTGPVDAPATEAAPLEPITSATDASSVEATAARLIAARDPRAAHAALEAARRYIADGRVDAASDLLLQLIASGIAPHEAQRLLVDVAQSLGKPDVAKAKVQLLVEALRLGGRVELAAEVEQLARAF